MKDYMLERDTLKMKLENERREKQKLEKVVSNIEESLSRLKKFKSDVADIKKRAVKMQNYNVADSDELVTDMKISWYGKNRDNYKCIIDDYLYNDYDTYIKAIDNILDNVTDQIFKMENTFSAKMSLIEQFKYSINLLKNEWEKFTN